MPKKTRLDVALVQRQLVESREKAQRLIMAGQVKIKGNTASKSSQLVSDEDEVFVVEGEKFVSRGGLKLEAAIHHFQISCRDKICLDLGASTGGFTDCLLQRGAAKVYAVDVGENQLAWKIRSDLRVVVLDDVNARYLKPENLSEAVDLITADVSFISICKVLPAAFNCSKDKAEFVVLIKPQFEAGRAAVERGGVVRDVAVHKQVVEKVQEFVISANMNWHGVIESPILGPAGNKEFLAYFSKK
jgi:23S rRNA (cytidine1920-2'-O)/16S rRNA (cytidine1409-2'-O)-methyltransferase